MKYRSVSIGVVLFTLSNFMPFTGPSMAAPVGGFIAVLDDDVNNSDSSNTVLYYDVNDMSRPMFAIFAGWKNSFTQTILGTSITTGEAQSLDSLAIDPATGLTYVIDVDRAGPTGSIMTPGPNNELFGVPENTEGDYNLLTFDFQAAYNHWAANFEGPGPGRADDTYVTYISGGTAGDPNAPAPAPGAYDLRIDNFQHYTAGPPNLNEVFLPGLVRKIGEVARPEFNETSPPSAGLFGYAHTHLEFIDADTLVLVDRPNADLSTQNDINALGQADDSTIRILNRIGTAPGLSTPYTPGSTVGGFDRGTTETWESVIIGQPLMDPDSPGEYMDVALVKNKNGVTGLWIVENDRLDGSGDEVSFFEITNLTGPAGNGLRQLNIGGGAPGFTLDDNPVLAANTGDGAADGVHVNPLTGDVFIIESGLTDSPQDEPSVIIREVTSYDNGSGQIEFGAWRYVQLDLTALPDDDSFVTDGRRTAYDYVNNTMYFYDFDTSAIGEGGNYLYDWYALDLDTGVVTQSFLNADDSTRGFRTEDRYEYFYLVPEPAGLLSCMVGSTILFSRKRFQQGRPR
ncbi:MAG: hypothetical protein R3C45_17235 [Phycisphaerales bacterium]